MFNKMNGVITEMGNVIAYREELRGEILILLAEEDQRTRSKTWDIFRSQSVINQRIETWEQERDQFLINFKNFEDMSSLQLMGGLSRVQGLLNNIPFPDTIADPTMIGYSRTRANFQEAAELQREIVTAGLHRFHIDVNSLMSRSQTP